jgi:Flp pilus assembly protein TadG
MARLHSRDRQRSGAALVETAAVVVIFLMVLFGVFEYCRMMFTRQLVDNAAREGARFAVVNTTDTNLVADTQAQVNYRMGGFQNAVKNWTVSVYHADSNGNPVYQYQTDSTGPYVQSTSGTKTYIQTNGSTGQKYIMNGSTQINISLNTSTSTVTDNSSGSFATWAAQNNIGNIDGPGNAAFGQYIAVVIDCDYNPIVPSLLFLNQTIHIRTKAFMYSEAN